MLLATALLTAPLTLLIEHLAHHRVHAFVIACGGAVVGAVVLLRLAGLVHAVERAGSPSGWRGVRPSRRNSC